MAPVGRVSEAEMKVMEKLWEISKMVSVAEITASLNEDGETWTHQTVGTFLKRLEAKEMVSSSKKGKSLYYFPLMSKEQFNVNEIDNIYKSNFGGSLKGFLSAFSSNKKFNSSEIQDLKDWLDDIDNK